MIASFLYIFIKGEINIAKMGTLNANLLRPGIRPGVNMAFSQMGPTAMYGPPQMTNRFNRYPFPPGQPNIRRPYNYPNQMVNLKFLFNFYV